MLQFITHRTARYNYIEGALEALNGGCKWIQLRMKDAHPDDVRHTVAQLKPACAHHEAILLLDDYVELAKELEVDGVHLGKNDMSPIEARKILGEQYIIGATANTISDIRNLSKMDIDYIGLGPFRYTKTKEKLSPILGIDGYREIMSICRSEGITTHIVAIGGIEIDDIDALMDTGISGIALSGTILNAESPQIMTQKIINKLNTRL